MDDKKGVRFGRGLRVSYFTIVVVVLLAAVVFKFVYQPETLSSSIELVVSAFSYIIWGFVIAYFLNPIVMFFQDTCNCNRFFAMVIVYLLFLGLIFLISFLVVPMVIQNLITLVEDLPKLVTEADHYIRDEILSSDLMQDVGGLEIFENWIRQSNEYISDKIPDWAQLIISNALNVTGVIIKFFVGVILSLYMLSDKDKLVMGGKRMVYAFMDKYKAAKVVQAANKTNLIFRKFIIGKTFDSLIIGIISYIVLVIIDVPMALLQAVIMAITNMIPSIGPIIGAVPCLLITLLFDPIKTLWVLIYIIVIQQIDGMLLGPKILGDTLGMSPLLIIAGVFIGGGFGGIAGMFLGPPILAAIKHFVDQYVDKQLEEKGLEMEG